MFRIAMFRACLVQSETLVEIQAEEVKVGEIECKEQKKQETIKSRAWPSSA